MKIDETFLRELDELRDSAPREAAQKARVALSHAHTRELVSRLLAIHGSACRAAGDLDEALDNLNRALQLAKQGGHYRIYGDLRQRLSVVHAYRGDYPRALRLAERAFANHYRMGNKAGMGRSLFDQGVWLYFLERTSESIKAFEQALDILPEKEYRNRFSAFLNLGYAYRRAGDLTKSDEAAFRGQELASHVGPGLSGKLLWFRARLAVELEILDRAEDLYLEAYHIYQEIGPIDAALLAVELVRLQLRTCKEKAIRTAKDMSSLLRRLRKSKIVYSAICEIIRAATIDQLTTDVLTKVDRHLESMRARKDTTPLLE